MAYVPWGMTTFPPTRAAAAAADAARRHEPQVWRGGEAAIGRLPVDAGAVDLGAGAAVHHHAGAVVRRVEHVERGKGEERQRLVEGEVALQIDGEAVAASALGGDVQAGDHAGAQQRAADLRGPLQHRPAHSPVGGARVDEPGQGHAGVLVAAAG